MILFDELVITERLRSTVIGLARKTSVDSTPNNNPPKIIVEDLRETMPSRSILCLWEGERLSKMGYMLLEDD